MQPLFVTHFFYHAVTARRLFFVGWLLAENFNFIFYLFCFFCHLYNHHECSCSLLLLFSSFMSGCPAGGFFSFSFTHIRVVLCCCSSLWCACLHGFGYILFSIFLFGFFVGCGKTRGKKSVFFFGVFYGLVFFFVLDFLYFISVLRYFCLLVIQFMNVECVMATTVGPYHNLCFGLCFIE